MRTAAISVTGGPNPTLDFYGHPFSHPLGDHYFSQCPVRYGDHVAKLGAFLSSTYQDALNDWQLDPNQDEDGFRHAAIDHFNEYDAVFKMVSSSGPTPTRSRSRTLRSSGPRRTASIALWPRSACRDRRALIMPPSGRCAARLWAGPKVITSSKYILNALHKIGIGTPLSRVDGAEKVTGRAKYAAEDAVKNLLYGIAVPARIAKGRTAAIDDRAARSVPGVVEVMTHENRPKQAWFDHSWKDELSIAGEPFKALHDDQVMFAGQPVALVIAETFEAVRFAASLIQVRYDEQPHNIDFDQSLADKFLPPKGMRRNTYHPPKKRGDAAT